MNWNLQVSPKLCDEPGCQQHVVYSGAAGLYFASQTGNHCSAVGLVWQHNTTDLTQADTAT